MKSAQTLSYSLNSIFQKKVIDCVSHGIASLPTNITVRFLSVSICLTAMQKKAFSSQIGNYTLMKIVLKSII